MADLAVTNTFTTGTTIVAAQVNSNFSDVVNYINNRNSASASWSALGVTGNGTIGGTFGVTGAATLSSTLAVIGAVTFSADTSIAATKKLYVDGGGDTYIIEGVANRFDFYTGGTARVVISGTSMDVSGCATFLLPDGTVSAPGMAFDTGTGDGLFKIGSHNIGFATNGTLAWNVTSGQVFTLANALLPASGGTGTTTKLLRTGTYTGNGTSQNVAHGLGATPDLVIISITGSGSNIPNIYITGMSANSHDFNGTNSTTAITAVDATNIAVGSSSAVNQNGVAYAFIAIKAQ